MKNYQLLKTAFTGTAIIYGVSDCTDKP